MALSDQDSDSRAAFQAGITTLMERIRTIPDSQLDYAILSFGSSLEADPNINTQTVVGGPTDYLLYALSTIVMECNAIDKEFVPKLIDRINAGLFDNMPTQGNA
jgi:hypothetical protein